MLVHACIRRVDCSLPGTEAKGGAKRTGSTHHRRHNRDKAALCNVRHSQQGNLSLAGYSNAAGAITSSLERLT